jgi:hypothetical protein
MPLFYTGAEAREIRVYEDLPSLTDDEDDEDDLNLIPRSEKPILFSGIFARDDLNVCGRTDPFFENANGRAVLASEIKTNVTFRWGSSWHRQRCAIQLISTLYAHNSPTGLVTQEHYKFFFESDERDMIYNSPADKTPN